MFILHEYINELIIKQNKIQHLLCLYFLRFTSKNSHFKSFIKASDRF